MRRVLLILLTLLILLSGLAYGAAPVNKTLANGVRLLLAPSNASPMVSVELLVNASACDERFPTRDEAHPWVRVPGLRRVLLGGMMQGSQTLDGATIHQTMTAAHGVLEARVQQDCMEFSLTVPAGKLGTGLHALSEIVCRAQLTDESIQGAIAQAKAELATPPSGVVELADTLSRQTLYADHPYANGGQGDARLLKLMDADMVRFIYPYFVRPESIVLAIAGHCVPADAQALVTHEFGAWKSAQDTWLREEAAVPVLADSPIVVHEAAVRTHCVMLSFPVCGVTEHDYLVLRLIDALMGGGTGSRLFRGVREERHLAYEISSRLTNQLVANTFSMYAVINSQHLDATKEALVQQAARLQQERISPAELARAQAYCIGRYGLSHQSNAQSAYDLAWETLSGQGSDYAQHLAARINAITAKDVQRVAQTYFTHYVLVVIAPNVLDQTGE